jgi:hypothetical protein
MEILLVLVVVFAVATLYKALQFANFKSQLMHALAQEGLAYNNANDLYSVHAKLVAQLRADGLSLQDIAKGIAGSAQQSSDQDIMARIRKIYSLAGRLATEIRLKSPSWGPGIFAGTEFAALAGAFVAAIKKHHDVSIEEASTGSLLLSAVQRQDMETICSVVEEFLGTIRQLSESDASGLMFHFFWP